MAQRLLTSRFRFWPAKRKSGATKAVTIYVRQDRQRFIVAAQHINADGIYYEQANPQVIDHRATTQELGSAFRQAFDAFSERDEDLRDHRTADWPAYRASKLRSARKFKQDYCRVSCFALNEANILVRASTDHPTSPDVALSVGFNPLVDAEHIGQKILRLLDAVWSLRSQS